jgi:hypothetical protein
MAQLRWDSFGRTLLFGALAAAAWPAWALMLSRLGHGTGLELYLVTLGAVYVAGLGTATSRGLGAALLALGFGAAVLLMARHPADVAIGSALAVGVCRSGFLYSHRPIRALLLEFALLGAGLAVAGWLATPGLLGVALAVWGFFLVQSLWFLVGGRKERTDTPDGVDPFEHARGRALALLDD